MVQFAHELSTLSPLYRVALSSLCYIPLRPPLTMQSLLTFECKCHVGADQGKSVRRLSPRPKLVGRSSPTCRQAAHTQSSIAADTSGMAPDSVAHTAQGTTSQLLTGRSATASPRKLSGNAKTFLLPRPFNSEQLRTLQIQMHVHVQLLVQTLILARAAMRTEPQFAQVALLAYAM